MISALPQSLETKSILGHTPLALAFHRGRIDVAKTLIEAGANQSTRDYMGRNILHLAIRDIRNSCRVDMKTIRSLLNLIDKRVLGSLFLERCQQGPGGLTPLARWFWQNTAALRYNIYDTKRSLEALQTILEFSNGEELIMMDGSGQFPLHQVIKNQYDGLAKPLIKKNPALLWKENAMGQTPFELAESLYHQRCVKKNPDIQPHLELAQNRDSQSFIPTQSQEASSDAAETQQENSQNKDLDPKSDTAIKQWRMCKAMAAKYPGKRILIPVHEAREVAKRLADSNRERKVSDGDEDEYDPDDDDEEDEKGRHSQRDEVSGWLGI